MTKNNRALARSISAEVGYTGGYVYPGARVSVKWDGIDPQLVPQLQTIMHSGRHWDNTTPKELVAHNKRALASCPIGAVVSIDRNLNDWRSWDTWIKTGPCAWTCVEMVDWPDWDDENSAPICHI